MAKRSPILGYNHNVRYRGLIFHVQTEDSGVLSPHLFTHLFHAGVIVSTRKLVYDAGSDEGAIKSLMQAQHKAVMKDLKKGTFDDKIDQYLVGVEGLLPRGAALDESQPAADGRDSQPVLAQSSAPDLPVAPPQSEPVSMPEVSLPEPMPAAPAEVDATVRNMPALEPEAVVNVNQTLRGTTPARASSEPRVTRPSQTPVMPTPTVPARGGIALDDEDLGLGQYSTPTRAQTQPDPPRTRTAERGSAPSQVRSSLPPPPPPPGDLDGPTSLDTGGAVAVAIANAQNNATIRTTIPPELGTSDSMNAIIALDLEETPSARTRSHRDTDVVLPGVDPEPTSDGVPGAVGAADTPRPRASESVPPLPPPPSASRPSTVTPAAGSLLPPRQATRPPARPAITPPQVMSRPLTENGRTRGDSDAVEVYAPAPPSAEAPPGVAPERPGQYSQHKRVSQKMPAMEPPRERSGAVPIPPGLGRPGVRSGSGPNPAVKPQPPPTPPPRDSRASSQPVPQPVRADPSSGAARPRTPTPGRTGPMGRPASNNAPNSGVVMTRPAVIVGAPAKPAQQRARKAREDEGRGFGQGLISEKSLDEVILAYLSEDADDK